MKREEDGTTAQTESRDRRNVRARMDALRQEVGPIEANAVESVDEGRHSFPKALPSWRTLGRQEVLSAPPWITVFRDAVALPSGKIVDDFYVIQLHEYAVVIALTADNRLVMERQYRYAAGHVSLQMPAGDLEPDEDALAAAQRELLEETGYVGDDWSFLGALVVDDNRGCGKAHYFLTRNARRIEKQRLDEVEDIEVLEMTLPELNEALVGREPVSMATVAALGLARSLDLI